MIVRLTCPECKKDSYSPSVEAFKPCPYCGILYSGRYGAEKRYDYRVQREIPIIFSYKGKNLEANTLNVSDTGLSLKIFGQPSLPVGDMMELDIGDSHVKTQVMWTYTDADAAIAVTGLKIIEGSINFSTLSSPDNS